MYLSANVGIDLGTSSVLVYVKGKGIILREPSVVAVRKGEALYDEEEILAVGEKALAMVGREPKNIETVYPMSGGVISNYEYTEKMLRYFLQKSIGRPLIKPIVAVCIPCKITEVERRAIMDACMDVGARSVQLIEEPVAAALGAGIEIKKPSGSMIVDIGGGTTDIAVISLGSIVRSDSVRIAGNVFDEDIIRFVKKKYGLIIGRRTAEMIKIQVGMADPAQKTMMAMKVKGRAVGSGLPTMIEVNGEDVADAVYESVEKLSDAICTVLENTPPELSADITEHGIVMTGGGSLLTGLDRMITARCRIKTFVADDALSCVAIGTGRFVDTLGNGLFRENPQDKAR